jgi:7-carboxy-7-deazaguanine synthase
MRAEHVIFPDVAASRNDYTGLSNDELLIASDGLGRTAIFYTLQGEGPFAGWPAVFVRLAGCNLGGKGVNGPGCQACDTDFRLSNGVRMTFDSILAEVHAARRQMDVTTGIHYRWAEKPLLVITGGEPLLQPNTTFFANFAHLNGYAVQIESNGMFPVVLSRAVYLVVSPKVPSNRMEYLPLPPEIFERADYLKMVVSADTLDPHHYLPDWVFDFAKLKPVYISPLAVYRKDPQKFDLGAYRRHSDIVTSVWSNDTYDNAKCAENYTYAALLCMRYNFRLSVQMHIFAVIP